MVTIACVLKAGEFANRGKPVEYTPQHVAFLKAQVEANLSVPHRFVCLSDVDVPCERIPLKDNWPGWWSKIELFRELESAFYIDLDTVICGDITDMVIYRHQFTVLRNLSKHNGAIGSGVMAWNGDYRYIYDKFKKSPQNYMEKYSIPTRWGDQGFIQDSVQNYDLFQNIWENCVLSYKFDLNYGKLQQPSNCKIIAYHGKPKPWEVSRKPA